VLEQYLEGEEYTVNGLLLESEYFPMSVTRRLLHPPPPLGVCISHRYPSLLPNEDVLFEQARAASRSLPAGKFGSWSLRPGGSSGSTLPLLSPSRACTRRASTGGKG
jgi:hypothetical protein